MLLKYLRISYPCPCDPHRNFEIMSVMSNLYNNEARQTDRIIIYSCNGKQYYIVLDTIECYSKVEDAFDLAIELDVAKLAMAMVCSICAVKSWLYLLKTWK